MHYLHILPSAKKQEWCTSFLQKHLFFTLFFLSLKWHTWQTLFRLVVSSLVLFEEVRVSSSSLGRLVDCNSPMLASVLVNILFLKFRRGTARFGKSSKMLLASGKLKFAARLPVLTYCKPGFCPGRGMMAWNVQKYINCPPCTPGTMVPNHFGSRILF